MKIVRLLYNIWSVFWFIAIFLVLFPMMYVCIIIKPWNRYGTKLTNYWADAWFFVINKPVKIDYQFRPKTDEQYIFVANHFSILDVAMGMKIIRNYFSYMGKSTVKNIPLIGYLFSQLHIQVDRSNRNSRAISIEKSNKALAEGRSLFIMPEGGIISQNIPKMHQPFKDGAFMLAIDNKVPIVPITYLNLYEIMPASVINFGKPKVIIHQKIETANLTKDDLESLKLQVYRIIQTDLDRYKGKNTE